MSTTDPASLEPGSDNTLNIAGEQTFPTPGLSVNPRITRRIESEVMRAEGTSREMKERLHELDLAVWGPPKYRDTHRRRVFTAGTLLYVLEQLGAMHESHGVRQSVVMAEMYKINAAYNEIIPMRETIYTDGHDIHDMLTKLDRIEKLVTHETVDTRLEAAMGRPFVQRGWKLTDRGERALRVARNAMLKAKSPAIVESAPIIAWASFSDERRLQGWYPQPDDAGVVTDAVDGSVVDSDTPPTAPQGSTVITSPYDRTLPDRTEARNKAHGFNESADADRDGLTVKERLERFDEFVETLDERELPSEDDPGAEVLYGEDAEVPVDEPSGYLLEIGWHHTIGGNMVVDNVLPRRRVTHKRPSFRQFCTMLVSGKDTITGAILHLQYYAPEDLWAALERIVVTPQARQLRSDYKKLQTRAFYAKPAARMLLSGGPESIWVGKELIPKNVLDDFKAFRAAGVPGFTERLVDNNIGTLIELFYDSGVTMHDIESYQRFASYVEKEYAGYERREIVYHRTRTLPEKERSRQRFRELETEILEKQREKREHAGAPTRKDAKGSGADIVGYDPEKAREAETETRATSDNQSVDDDMLQQVAPKSWNQSAIDLLIEPGIVPKRRCQWWYEPNPSAKDKKAREGHQCSRLAAGTSDYCELHGGSVLVDAGEIQNLISANARKMLALSGKAIEAVTDVLINSPNDASRLQAAKMILDKSGFSDSVNIGITERVAGSKDDNTDDMQRPASEIIRERLNRLGSQLRDNNVIDAEVEEALDGDHLPNEPDQSTLDDIEGEIVEENDESTKRWLKDVQPDEASDNGLYDEQRSPIATENPDRTEPADSPDGETDSEDDD